MALEQADVKQIEPTASADGKEVSDEASLFFNPEVAGDLPVLED